jgi:hypothetical protein
MTDKATAARDALLRTLEADKAKGLPVEAVLHHARSAETEREVAQIAASWQAVCKQLARLDAHARIIKS